MRIHQMAGFQLNDGELGVVVGKIKSGKSSVLVRSAVMLAKEGINVLLVTPEGLPLRMRAMLSEAQEGAKGKLMVDGTSLYISDVKEKIKTDPILQTNPAGAILFDSVHLMYPAPNENLRPWERLGRCVSDCSSLARLLRVPVVLTVQTNVQSGDLHDLGRLAGSQKLTEVPEVYCTVENLGHPAADGLVDVHVSVLKHRYLKL